MPALEPHAEAEEEEGEDAEDDGQGDCHGVGACCDVGLACGVAVAVVAVGVIIIVVVPCSGGDDFHARPDDAVPARGDVYLGGLGEEEARLGGEGGAMEIRGEDGPSEAAGGGRD